MHDHPVDPNAIRPITWAPEADPAFLARLVACLDCVECTTSLAAEAAKSPHTTAVAFNAIVAIADRVARADPAPGLLARFEGTVRTGASLKLLLDRCVAMSHSGAPQPADFIALMTELDEADRWSVILDASAWITFNFELGRKAAQ